MKLVRSLIALSAATFVLAGGALAQGTLPTPGELDPRIRTVTYNPDQVIELAAHLGYQMMIEFGTDERIENVSIGDSVSWQITPNRAANLLFVKPVERNTGTNMTVVTNLRRYSFDLSAYEVGRAMDRVTYDLRFVYPPTPTEAQPTAADAAPTIDLSAVNLDYSFSGAHDLEPARVFDDGRLTYFQFAAGVDTPAMFVIGADGGEELVNSQVRGNYTVVDRVATDFVLRYGKRHTRVHNDHISPRRGFHLWGGSHNQQEGANHAQ